MAAPQPRLMRRRWAAMLATMPNSAIATENQLGTVRDTKSWPAASNSIAALASVITIAIIEGQDCGAKCDIWVLGRVSRQNEKRDGECRRRARSVSTETKDVRGWRRFPRTWSTGC